MVQSKQTALEKRARSKYISFRLACWLLFGAPHSPLQKSYRDSLYCCHVLRVEDRDRITGKYCKHRWCLTCNRIRMAVLILGYGPQLRQLGNLWFVTLTARTVCRADLPQRLAEMGKVWSDILALNRKKCQRNRGLGLKGLRKLECNPRPEDFYHPHFHILVQGEQAARWLVAQWLQRWGDLANASAQDARPADDQSLIELFKYQVKLPTKQKGEGDYSATADQLDWIYQCLRGKRTFQPFGGLTAICEELDDDLVATGLPEGLEGLIWQWHEQDWVSELGELLTNWEPTEDEATYLRDEVGCRP